MEPWATGAAIFVVTLFLDLLDLSFGRILWFARTLRFWLYFLLHLLLACLATFFVSDQVPEWYLRAPLGTFLGVAILSNTDVKIAGYSLLPIASLFIGIKAKMTDHASEDKAESIEKAKLVERLQKLPLDTIEEAFRAGMHHHADVLKRA